MGNMLAKVYENIIGMEVDINGKKEKGQIIDVYENDLNTVFVVATKNRGGVMELKIEQFKAVGACITEKKEQLDSQIKKLEQQRKFLEQFQEIHEHIC